MSQFSQNGARLTLLQEYKEINEKQDEIVWSQSPSELITLLNQQNDLFQIANSPGAIQQDCHVFKKFKSDCN
jgi:hypothetical protein